MVISFVVNNCIVKVIDVPAVTNEVPFVWHPCKVLPSKAQNDIKLKLNKWVCASCMIRNQLSPRSSCNH
jgi:hypothetical protein